MRVLIVEDEAPLRELLNAELSRSGYVVQVAANGVDALQQVEESEHFDVMITDLKMDQIDILIHPQSIVHSMVEYKDGSVIAQMGIPDMTIPIAYALSYPRHLDNALAPLDLKKVGTLSFKSPDLNRFRCLKLALDAATAGASMPAVLNGANEIAVDAFLAGRIGFLDIPDLIEETMHAHVPLPVESIEAVMASDRWARDRASEILNRRFT